MSLQRHPFASGLLGAGEEVFSYSDRLPGSATLMAVGVGPA